MQKLESRKGIWHPKDLKKKSLLVAGPPGCGKSYLLKRLGGSPGEICINVAIKKWWSSPALAPRPKELHFALPFDEFDESLPVYDDRWAKAKKLPLIDPSRIRIPKKKKFFLATNWRAKFVFDFILPPPDWNWEMRKKRMKGGDERLVDAGLSKAWVTWQIQTHWWMAWHLYRAGLHVMIRPFNVAYPYPFSQAVAAVRKKGDLGKGSVFPKGADLGFDMDLQTWIKRTAPKEWRKLVRGK